ncbi:MAG: FAD-binding domain-containing protein [Fermentimonas caenicola]|jgi:hypothetical protein
MEELYIIQDFTYSMIHLGYLGALQTIWANHVFSPISKLKTFKVGTDNIEQAIQKEPGNVELRFIRLSVQKNAPSFLGYQSHIKEDMEFIENHRHQIHSDIPDKYIRQLNQTGYMHNRVRMIVASFLCKHLLIDWCWGETYFAQKLNDYDLSANNENWQWAAGSGCDATPFFRIFNSTTQTEKFDKDFGYAQKWLPEFGTDKYPKPIVEHRAARERALKVYRHAINEYA